LIRKNVRTTISTIAGAGQHLIGDGAALDRLQALVDRLVDVAAADAERLEHRDRLRGAVLQVGEQVFRLREDAGDDQRPQPEEDDEREQRAGQRRRGGPPAPRLEPARQRRQQRRQQHGDDHRQEHEHHPRGAERHDHHAREHDQRAQRDRRGDRQPLRDGVVALQERWARPLRAAVGRLQRRDCHRARGISNAHAAQTRGDIVPRRCRR
jgi:hypothetical protein